MESLLTTLAVEVIPACALRAIFGLGLKEATNWSLRAANKRTTLLLVWDKDDKKEKSGIPKYRGNRGRKRRRETGPRDTPPPHLTTSSSGRASTSGTSKEPNCTWDYFTCSSGIDRTFI
ncbi:hypothetical protein ACJMK2_044324 [Sinanodonta woodiana]|uniref:Uncharacterized protein n=1 Tax=Sinanodonta woodiana TaxID=1069815 RepID=A0ABD3W1K6_SINWO